MNLKELKPKINELEIMNQKSHSLVKKLKELDELTDKEKVILNMLGSQLITITCLSELISEVSTSSIMANDIVENLSKTTGKGIDAFINEFSTRSSEVIDKKLEGVTSDLEAFSQSVNNNIKDISTENQRQGTIIKNWVKNTISPLSNYIKSSKINSILITFIISIFGGLVAIKIYQIL